MLRIDIGCGSSPHEGCLGVDVVGTPDYLCDITSEKLPFPDGSVDYVISTHCFEHIPHNRMLHVFQEIARVSRDNASLEFWHPHVYHEDAFIFSHINYIGEQFYNHFCFQHRKTWAPHFGAELVLSEIRYGIDKYVMDDMQDANIDLDFAVSYFHNVIREIGIFCTVKRTEYLQPDSYKRTVSFSGERSNVVHALTSGPRQCPLSRRTLSR